MLTIKLVTSLLLEQRIAKVTWWNFLHLEPLKFVPTNLKIGGWEIVLPGWGGEFGPEEQSFQQSTNAISLNLKVFKV